MVFGDNIIVKHLKIFDKIRKLIDWAANKEEAQKASNKALLIRKGFYIDWLDYGIKIIIKLSYNHQVVHHP